jgi:AcrR family transcriptional regulator
MTVQENLADTRRRDILRAALQCFTAKGFHATTMIDIARAAKMSAGNLYNYFSGKVDIVEALARNQLEHMKKNLQDFHLGLCSEQEMRAQVKRIALARLDSQAAKIALEILSESTRNERMGRVLNEFDAQWRKALLEVMRNHSQKTEQDLLRQIEFNLTLMDGLGARLVAHPELDRDALASDIAEHIVPRNG